MKKSIKMLDINEEVAVPTKVVEKKEASNYLPILELPSKYRLYPQGTKILARPMNVLEVKLLSSMNESNYSFVMNDILKSTTKGIEVDDILVDDKHFIIFWLRANTYKNSGYEVDFHCGKCDKQSKYNFDVNVLDVEYLRDDYSVGEEKELPVSKDRISIKFKTIADEKKLQEFLKRSKSTLSKYDDDILSLASSVDKINDENLSLLQKYNYIIEKMTAEDFSYFISYVESFVFGVKDKIKAVCNTCKEETPIGVSFRSEFFLPRNKF